MFLVLEKLTKWLIMVNSKEVKYTYTMLTDGHIKVEGSND